MLWVQLVYDDEEVRCRGCDTMVDLSEAESINEGIDLWNTHVSQCPAAEDDSATGTA